MTSDASANFSSTVEYCRQARRLRHRHASDPVRLHKALRKLARPAPTTPVASPAPITVRLPALPEPAAVCPSVLLGLGPDREEAVRRFVTHVRMRMIGTTFLTSSQRETLLNAAGALRVERFHANLVIAALLHEAQRAAE